MIEPAVVTSVSFSNECAAPRYADVPTPSKICAIATKDLGSVKGLGIWMRELHNVERRADSQGVFTRLWRTGTESIREELYVGLLMFRNLVEASKSKFFQPVVDEIVLGELAEPLLVEGVLQMLEVQREAENRAILSTALANFRYGRGSITYRCPTSSTRHA